MVDSVTLGVTPFGIVSIRCRLGVGGSRCSSHPPAREGSPGSYTSRRTSVDGVLVNQALDYTGPYFQAGCIGDCLGLYTARFDKVSVGLCDL